MALPLLGLASFLGRNMNRVLPNISRLGASVMRRPPKFFSYQLAAAAWSGTFTWTWSYGNVCALTETAKAPKAKHVKVTEDRIRVVIPSMRAPFQRLFSVLYTGPRQTM